MNTQEIIKLYQEGASQRALAQKFNTYPGAIKKILVENNIPIRNRSQQNVITNQARTKKVNNSYFKEITNVRQAWILGFLAADGSVAKDRNSIKIALSSVDREILEKIQKELEIERKIRDSETNNGFQVSELVWSSQEQKIDLAKYDIVPNKTYKTINLPIFEDSNLTLAYILGYFDGDGCFKNDGTTCRLEFCAYSSNLLEQIAAFLNNMFNATAKVYHDTSRASYYTLTYSTKKAEPILTKCYEIAELYLSRKKEKFTNWQKQNNRI